MFMFKYIQQLSRRILSLGVEGLGNHDRFVYFLKIHSGNKFTERLETILNENRESMENDMEIREIAEKQKLPITLHLRLFS